jgi:CheY-like chemotaxis protein
MRLLIVDDDSDIRLMLRIRLQGQGWDTEEAVSGHDALERLDGSETFDVIVLDHRMPGLTGLELARNLREQGLALPIIICSAYLNPEIEEQAHALGVPTVNKADLDLLIEMIAEHAAS